MTVIDNRKYMEPRFEDLSPGDTFYWKGFYFIRLKFNVGDNESYNAVCLTDGIPECFSDDEPVFLVDATLTIS